MPVSSFYVFLFFSLSTLLAQIWVSLCLQVLAYTLSGDPHTTHFACSSASTLRPLSAEALAHAAFFFGRTFRPHYLHPLSAETLAPAGDDLAAETLSVPVLHGVPHRLLNHGVSPRPTVEAVDAGNALRRPAPGSGRPRPSPPELSVRVRVVLVGNEELSPRALSVHALMDRRRKVPDAFGSHRRMLRRMAVLADDKAVCDPPG